MTALSSPASLLAGANELPLAKASIRARFIEKRTYLRPLDEDSITFETPRQALDRVMGHQRWLWETELKRPLNSKEELELDELRTLIEAKKVSVSGRVKWMGGTDIIKERASAAFNCLGVETRFITTEGVKSFADFVDGDETMVWTHKGRWRKAVVRSYGEQKLNRVTFGRTKSEIVVRATDNHRWLLDNGRGETTALAVRDRIARPVSDFASWVYDAAEIDEKTWWAYGYVYGDGTITRKNGDATGSMVRLCGKDKGLYLDRFVELGFTHSFPPSCNDDPIVYTGRYRKTLPEAGADPRLIRAFVRGYLDADGHLAPGFASAFSRILATSDEAQTFIRDFFPVAGVFVASEREANQETNFGTRSNKAHWFNLFDTCGEATNSSFIVRKIEEDTIETVWCLEVEEDHSFTLANGVVTGNCSFTIAETPADFTDIFWLLLQGCGVGFRPKPGLLTGLPATFKTVKVIGSERADKGGQEDTTSIVEDGVWTIKFGDSAKGWAKAVGKLLANKPRAHTLVIDLSELRPGGKRLKGYGWLSSGWKPLADGMKIITDVLMAKQGQALDAIDIGDMVNALGTVLSSRRSAQIWLYETRATTWADFNEELLRFVDAKTDRYTYHLDGLKIWMPPADFDWSAKGALETLRRLAAEAGATNKVHREQSNNSVVFNQKPDRDVIVELLKRILDTGEPGFVNGAAARKRAPEMEGLNPCAEILLPSKGFCNLMQVVWHRFNGDYWGLLRAQFLAGRANYRQTCVSMRDGVLQLQWEDNQKLLRLCGVSPTGYVSWEGIKDPDMHEGARDAAIDGANSMADELGLPRPRRVTQCQPAGTSSKVMGLEGDEVHEGAHVSPSRFIFNNVNFSVHDNIVEKLMLANYDVKPNPADKTGVLVKFPVAYPDSPFYSKVVKEIDGRLEELEIVSETGVDQLERYRMLMEHYVQHNCSITVSFDVEDIEPMADWFMQHWDTYIGVSFLKRNDPTRTAEELGFKYLPQECVSKRMYDDYVASLLPVDLEDDTSDALLDINDCATGSCPVR